MIFFPSLPGKPSNSTSNNKCKITLVRKPKELGSVLENANLKWLKQSQLMYKCTHAPCTTKRMTDMTHEGSLEQCVFICIKYFTHLPNLNPVLQLFNILQKCSRSSRKEPQRQHEDRRKCLVIRQWREFKVNPVYQYRYWKKWSLLIAQKEYIKIFQLRECI